jgi:hypothetical protein
MWYRLWAWLSRLLTGRRRDRLDERLRRLREDG